MTGRPTTITTCTGAGCRRRIMWCVTLNGRRMPLDPEPAADGNVVVTMLPDGTIRGRVLTGRELPAMVEAYRPHHRTCPAAADFRRRQSIAAARCRVCGEPMDPWLADNAYNAHIGCLPPISLRGTVQALRAGASSGPAPERPPADHLPGLGGEL